MIINLDQLRTFMESDAQDFEELFRKNRYLLKAPGCSDEDIKFIEKNIGNIPSVYKKIIQKYDFFKKIIGFFSLSPIPSGGQNMADSIINANIHEPFLSREFLDKKSFIWIGSNNDYTVYVSKGSEEFKEDEIVLIDEEIIGNEDNPRPEDIRPTAKDFEQFLIAAGNLNEIHREIKEDNSNWEEKKNEFIERLRILGVDEKYHKAWLNVF
jgi:hypothetical protein